jgi:transposase-like protein
MREAGIDVTTIAETLKVSRVTVYRHTEPVTEDVPEVVLAAQVH